MIQRGGGSRAVLEMPREFLGGMEGKGKFLGIPGWDEGKGEFPGIPGGFRRLLAGPYREIAESSRAGSPQENPPTHLELTGTARELSGNCPRIWELSGI